MTDTSLENESHILDGKIGKLGIIGNQKTIAQIKETGFEDDVWIAEDDRQHTMLGAGYLSDRARKVLEQGCHLAACQAAMKVADTVENYRHLLESEIEKIFLSTFVVETLVDEQLCVPEPDLWESDISGFVDGEIDNFMERSMLRCGPTPITLVTQVPISGYRVDFLLYGTSALSHDRSKWKRIKLVVECDGHDFHERTKDQAKRDKKRDRDLAAMGFTVMRFTGSEIWNNPRACLQEAVSFIRKIQSDYYTECVREACLRVGVE